MSKQNATAMAATEGEDCTTLMRAPTAGLTPCYRHPSGGIYVWPKKRDGGIRFQAKQAKSVSLEVAKALYGAKGQASKSVERWQAVFGVNNYGIAYVNETHADSTDDTPLRGEYPFLVLDVEGFPEMKHFIHLPPPDVCAKLMPQIRDKIADDPASEVLDWDSEKDEKKKLARDRFLGLNWKPEHCTSYNTKEKRWKPALPNPASNDWALIPPETAEGMKWSIAHAPSAAAPKKVAGKRKESETATIEGLHVVKSPELDAAGYAWLLTLPIDEHCMVEKIDGTLRVVQHKKVKAEEAEAPAAEGEVAE
jgi:hypothetical protein